MWRVLLQWVLDISVQGNTILLSGKHPGGSGVKSPVCALCFPILGQQHRTHFIPIPGGESLCFTHSLKVKIKDNLPFRSSSSQLTNPPFQGHPLPSIHSASFSPPTHVTSNYILKGTAVFQSTHMPRLRAFTFDLL